MPEKIAAAVSGGQDSTLTLALLKEQGLDVIAIHAFFLSPTAQHRKTAEALGERCARLGVPFHAVDLHEEFEAQVVQPFIRDYVEGRTPNPCVSCNRTMKFGLLLDAAEKLGATRISTGHYVRTLEHEKYGHVLARGKDPVKEQSYFLSLVPKERLAKAVFPLGDWLKKDVMGALNSRELPPPLPSESQEICFIPGDDYKKFLLGRKAPLGGPGDIVLTDGTRVGRHKGLWRYTLGQRRGLGVAWKEPLYVLDKDIRRNRLIAGPKSELYANCCTADNVNVLVPEELWPETVLARTRYRQQAKPARARIANGKLKIDFIEPHTRPTPGQIAALYTEDGVVLAGGVIL